MDPIELLTKVKVQTILEYLIDLKNFFLYPKKFFLCFFQKDNVSKLLQIVFYILLTISIYILFDERETFNSSIKWTIIGWGISLVSVFVLISTRYVLIKIFKNTHIAIDDIFLYVFIGDILISVIGNIFDLFFEKTHIYEFAFITKLIDNYMAFYILILSNFIFYKGYKQILSGMIITCVIANLTVLTIPKLSFDENFIIAILGHDDSTESLISILGLKSSLSYEDMYKQNSRVLITINDTLNNNAKYFINSEDKILDSLKAKMTRNFAKVEHISKLQSKIDSTNAYIAQLKSIVKDLKEKRKELKFKREIHWIDVHINTHQDIIDFYNSTSNKPLVSTNLFYFVRNDKISYIKGTIYLDLRARRDKEVLEAKRNIYKLLHHTILPDAIMNIYFFDLGLFKAYLDLKETQAKLE